MSELYNFSIIALWASSVSLTLFECSLYYILNVINDVASETGDREAEARVDDRLLIPFHKLFTWSDSEPSAAVDGRPNEQIGMNKTGVSCKQVRIVFFY